MATSLAAFNVDSDTANVSIGFSGDDDGASDGTEPDFSNLASAFFGDMAQPDEPVIAFDDDSSDE